jgi:hypothetical protein
VSIVLRKLPYITLTTHVVFPSYRIKQVYDFLAIGPFPFMEQLVYPQISGI